MRSLNLALKSGYFVTKTSEMMFMASAYISSCTLLLISYAGFWSRLRRGFKIARKASIEGKPGIVESPGKFIMAFWISLSEIYSVAA